MLNLELLLRNFHKYLYSKTLSTREPSLPYVTSMEECLPRIQDKGKICLN